MYLDPKSVGKKIYYWNKGPLYEFNILNMYVDYI